MFGKNTRPVGAMAVDLDDDNILLAARAALAAQDPEFPVNGLETDGLGYMLIAVDDGRLAVVNSEGVGHVADEDGTIEIDLIHGFQILTGKITSEDIVDAATFDVSDLAEGIRVFGARLDNNHRRWFDRYNREASDLLIVAAGMDSEDEALRDALVRHRD